MTYVLRHELVHMYAQHKFAMMRQELLQAEISRQKALTALTKPALESTSTSDAVPVPAPLAVAADVASVSKDELVKKDDVDSNPSASISADSGPLSPVPVTPDFCRTVASPETNTVEPANPVKALSESFSEQETESNIAAHTALVKQENLDENESKESLEALNEKHAKDLNAKLLAISADNLGIVLNANCFIDGFECDVDPVVALKDEETARVMADFLYKQALSAITEQVRVVKHD